MSGSNYVLDTNIVSYFLNGNRDVASFFNSPTVYISIVSELELLSDPKLTQGELDNLKNLLETLYIVEINQVIKEYTVELKKRFKIKLPDAIIAATSLFLGYKLVTSDSIFKKISVPILYYEKQP